ncbi:hypothetical protein L7F22_049328 [Adiantum nelumboides]|nr:hypothetical protein [Adiantum nelumboides]
MEKLEFRIKALECKNAKLKEEILSLKEEVVASKELKEEGEIQEVDKVAIKEATQRNSPRPWSLEIKMEAPKEGWVDVVRSKIKKEVKEEKQHKETLWMHATLEEKKMREAHMLNVRVSGIKEENGALQESNGRELCTKFGYTTPFTKEWRAKLKRKEDAVVFIQFVWRRHLRRKRAKEALERKDKGKEKKGATSSKSTKKSSKGSKSKKSKPKK